MGIESTSNLQSAIESFRAAEAGQFRQTLDKSGALQQAAGAGGVKGKLVAWVLASPGREGSFAGRGVKALVNLFGKGNFEAVSSALQNSRETSVNNLFNAVLRHGERQLDADFSKQFSGAAQKQARDKGTNFSARDFTGLQQTLKDLVARQNRSRQDAIAAVQGGAPTDRMKALSPAELAFAARVLSPANDGGQRQISKFPDDVDQDKFHAVDKELNAMSRQLREHLNNTLSPPGEKYTVAALKQEGRPDDDFHLQEARAAVQKQVSDFRESYVGALNTLAQVSEVVGNIAGELKTYVGAPNSPVQEPAASRPAAAETPSQPAATITEKGKLQQELKDLQLRHNQALSEFDANKQTYMDVKQAAEKQKGEDGELAPREKEKVESYRKLAEESKSRVLQLRHQLVELDRQLANA
ncbi:MAG: hypothetical protein OXS28_06575 [Gammaproteobacteria bacterium]|nr:hypothetical protein [Gammaproteobacteria bacterium]MDE0282959.1 hypothetical protein [Gammaproteobacteria bacterium]